MSSDPDFHAAANAWLDGAEPSSTHQLLREFLRDHSDNVAEFAMLARTEAALHIAGTSRNERLQRASRLLQPSWTNRLRLLIARPVFHWPAAALLISGGLWFLLSGQDPPPLREPRIPPTTARTAPPALAIRVSDTSQPSPVDAAFIRRMDRFIVPDFHVKDATLEEAFKNLRNTVQSIDPDAVPEFSAGEEVSASARVNLHVKYQSVEMLVKLISIQTGTAFQPSGRGYLLSPDPKARPLDWITYRAWNRTTLASFFQSQGKPLGGPPGSKEIDDVTLTANVNQVIDAFEDIFGKKPSSVVCGKSEIMFTTGSREDSMLTNMTSLENGNLPGTWKWTAHVLHLKTPGIREAFERLKSERRVDISGSGTTLTNDDATAILRELADAGGVETISIPPLTTGPGATESAFAGKESPDPVAKPDYWTGMRIEITNEPRGDHGGLSLRTVQQQIDNPEAPDAAIATSEMSTKVSIDDGRTLLLGGLISEKDGETAVLLSARRDPPAQDVPWGIPVSGNSGMVHSPWAPNGGVVDVAGMKRGTKMKCPFTGHIFRVP